MSMVCLHGSAIEPHDNVNVFQLTNPLLYIMYSVSGTSRSIFAAEYFVVCFETTEYVSLYSP